MAKLVSEMDRWEQRVKTQGEIVSKKKRRQPSKLEGRPGPDIQKPKCKDTNTIGHTLGTVKPKIDRSLLNNPVGSKRKEPKSIRPTKTIQQYMDTWNASMFPKLREFKSAKDEEASRQTKTYKCVVKLLKKLIKGTLYNGGEPTVRFPDNFQRQLLRIPIERFRYLVKNMERKAFNSDYLPRNKTYLSKTTLTRFLIGNGLYGAIPSFLLEHALTPAVPNTTVRPKDPRLTEVFRELFLKRTCRHEDSLTFAERNHLVGASNKYLDFFAHFKDTFEVYGYTDPIDFLGEYYWKAIGDSWPGKKVKKIPLGYLNSSGLIVKVIVPHFLKVGLLKDYDFEGTSKGYWK